MNPQSGALVLYYSIVIPGKCGKVFNSVMCKVFNKVLWTVLNYLSSH